MPDFIQAAFGRKPNAIGRDVVNGGNVSLRHLERSTYILGAHGTGKSTCMLHLILCAIRNYRSGIVVLDPHGQLVNDLLLHCPPQHADRIIYFAPAEQRAKPLGFNPFEWRAEEGYGHKVAMVLSVFQHLWGTDWAQTPQLLLSLETCIRTLFAAYPHYQTHFMHMLHLVSDTVEGKQWRRKLAQAVQDDDVLRAHWEAWNKTEKGSTWNADTKSSRTRISHILNNATLRPILCQPISSSCLHFEEILSQKKILCVNLSNIEGEQGWQLLGSLILAQLVAMGYQREQIPENERVPCHIFADEYDSFVPQMFSEIIFKLRKYKLFTTIAHQSLSQVSGEALAAALNCGNMILFRVNSKESRILGSELYQDNSFPKNGLMSLPLYEAMVKYQDGRNVLQARVKMTPNSEVARSDVAHKIRQRSLDYGRFVEPAPPQVEINPLIETNKQPSISVSSVSEIDNAEWLG